MFPVNRQSIVKIDNGEVDEFPNKRHIPSTWHARQLILGSKTNARNANVPPLDISFQFPHISAACRWNMRGTRRIARWNGGLMAGEISARLFGRLDWRWANSISGSPVERIFRSWSRCRATGQPVSPVSRENDETASLPPSTVSWSRI